MIRGDISYGARFLARGGNGGDAFGVGGVAGNGGRPYVQAHLLESFLFAEINQIAGHGGTGFDGATGGRGAASTFGFNAQQLTADTLTSSNSSSLYLRLVGGKGGDSYNGTVGRGGTARLNLEFVAAISTAESSYVNAYVQAGQGGRGFATGNQDVDGVSGAVAVLKSSADQAMQSASLSIRGGNGGSALGRLGQGNGGEGAAAILDGPLRISSSTSSSNLQLSMFGGIGGVLFLKAK